MPTGYTYDVQNGKVTEFNDFAKRCARAFGAYVTLRDEPNDIELPRSVSQQATYHKKELDEAKQELIRIENMTIDQLARASHDEYESDIKYHEKAIAECKLHEIRYKTMLAKVKNWNPPTNEHIGLKDFMIQQLTDSIKYDCSTDYYEKNKPTYLHYIDYKEKKLKKVNWDIEYHSKELEKDKKLDKSRNEWIEKFFESLGE